MKLKQTSVKIPFHLLRAITPFPKLTFHLRLNLIISVVKVGWFRASIFIINLGDWIPALQTGQLTVRSTLFFNYVVQTGSYQRMFKHIHYTRTIWFYKWYETCYETVQSGDKCKKCLDYLEFLRFPSWMYSFINDIHIVVLNF